MSKKFTISELERIRLESICSDIDADLSNVISIYVQLNMDLKHLVRQFPTGAHIAAECRQLRAAAYSILQDMKQLQQDLSRLDLESLVNDEA